MTGAREKSDKLMNGKKSQFRNSLYFAVMQSGKAFYENFAALPECGDRIVKL